MPLPSLLARIFGGVPAVRNELSADQTLALLTRSGHWTSSGFIDDSWGYQWWQKGYNPIPPRGSAIVFACVQAYSQTLAQCPGSHWRATRKGGRERVENSALTRILRQPNSYQSISDFLLNLGRSLYNDGNAFALAQRNSRFEVAALHLMDPTCSSARVAPTGDVFYSLGGNDVVERMLGREVLSYVPARDVLHVRLNAPKHPLIGEPPLNAAMMEIATSNAVVAQTLAFINRQARPSFVLQTDMTLNREKVQELRELWDAQTQRWNAGGTPILSSGLKPAAISTTSRDAQLAEILQVSDQRIATAYRVPLQILSLSSGAGPQGSTESLLQFWLSTGLGFCLNHVEEAMGLFFGLRGWPNEYLEFDAKALLRSSYRDRIEALVRGVQGGVFAPNEARAEEELPAVEYGDEPRVQQQDVPLSAWYATMATPPVLAPPSEPAPPAPPSPPQGQGNAVGSAELTERIYRAIERYERAN